jgi:uncharacterized protein (UPF0335 family)
MTNNQVADFVKRIEDREVEKAEIADDIRSIYAEAKNAGLNVRAIRAIVSERKKDAACVEALQSVIDEYKSALGSLSDLPLGQSAINRLSA